MKSFVVSDSDVFAAAFEKLGYFRIRTFGELESKLAGMQACNDAVREPLAFGFVFESRGKGLNPETEDFVAGLSGLFDDWRFEHMFAISYGGKSEFNLYVLESVLMNFGASLSYAVGLSDFDDSRSADSALIADKVSKEADCGGIRLVKRPFFCRRSIRGSLKRISEKIGNIRSVDGAGGVQAGFRPAREDDIV